MRRALIVPAAGLGTRLKWPLPKALVPVGGKAMLDRVLDRHASHVASVVVVAHPSFAGQVEAHLRRGGRQATVVVQDVPTGMLDAILLAMDAAAVSSPDRVWISWCDQVATSGKTLVLLDAADRNSPAPALVLPTAMQADPYIHFERDRLGRISDVRQRREGDVMPDVGESDAGVFSLSWFCFSRDLPRYAAGPASAGRQTKERNLLPFVAWLEGQGRRVVTFPLADPREARGVNTPEDLAAMEAYVSGTQA